MPESRGRYCAEYGWLYKKKETEISRELIPSNNRNMSSHILSKLFDAVSNIRVFSHVCIVLVVT